MVKREESEAELRGIAEGVRGQARRECRGRREEEEKEGGRLGLGASTVALQDRGCH